MKQREKIRNQNPPRRTKFEIRNAKKVNLIPSNRTYNQKIKNLNSYILNQKSFRFRKLYLESCIVTRAGYGFFLYGTDKSKGGDQHKIQDPDHFFF